MSQQEPVTDEINVVPYSINVFMVKCYVKISKQSELFVVRFVVSLERRPFEAIYTGDARKVLFLKWSRNHSSRVRVVKPHAVREL
jgi:hypothetical protein